MEILGETENNVGDIENVENLGNVSNVGDVTGEATVGWGGLIEQTGTSWDDLEENDTKSVEDSTETPKYDKTLYSSESEYLAAQQAAAVREGDEDSRGMTTRELNRWMFQEASRDRNSEEQVAEEVVTSVPEETIDDNAASSEQDNKDPEEVVIPGEEWYRSIISELDVTKPRVEQLRELNRGSRLGEEMSGILAGCVQNMMEKSAAYLGMLQSERNLGKFELTSAVYAKEMAEQYQYATQALQALRMSMMGKPLPKELMNGITSNIQEVENNLSMVKDAVDHKPQPMVTAEKIASDEAELKRIYEIK